MDILGMVLPGNGAINAQLSQITQELTTNGVVSGLVVAQQTIADLTVKVSAGVIYLPSYARYSISAVTSIAVTTADATNPRIDIVYVSSAGVITYLAGTPAATPSAPATPSGGALLATIAVAAGATTVVTANITDMREPIWSGASFAAVLQNSWAGTLLYRKSDFSVVNIYGALTVGTGTALTVVGSLPAGYIPSYVTAVLFINSNTGAAGNLFVDSVNGNIKVVGAQSGGHVLLVNSLFRV